MDILINVVLPLSLAIIMLSLGIGLTFNDFARVMTRFKAFAVGAMSQLILLPLIAYIIATLFGLPAELAVGLMLLSFCPGGVTSNMIAKLAKGDVALSVSLTAIVSLVTETVLSRLSWIVISQTWVDFPRCTWIARPVTSPPLAERMWLVLMARPTA